MVKLVFLCRRRPDISHERYVECLLRGHVPIALAHHPTLRRYVVNVVEESCGPAPALDSIGELWFDSLADYRERLYDSAEGARLVARDVAGFLGGAHAYVTVEDPHASHRPATPLGARSPGGKLVVCVTRAPESLGRDEFRRRWLQGAPAPALRSPAATGYVTGVVEERLDRDGPDYDGLATVRFAAEDRPHGMGGPVPDAAGAPFLATVHAYRVSEYVERW